MASPKLRNKTGSRFSDELPEVEVPAVCETRAKLGIVDLPRNLNLTRLVSLIRRISTTERRSPIERFGATMRNRNVDRQFASGSGRNRRLELS